VRRGRYTDDDGLHVLQRQSDSSGYGKNAYTFIRRSDGHAIRIVSRPNGWPEDNPERQALLERIKVGSASTVEQNRYWELQEERAMAVLDLPEAQLFEVQQMAAEVPKKARLNASINCEECKEPTMETRIRRFDGRNLCIPCFEAAESR
jgi:formylmethanofuran dehydrogenase subunit E